MPDQDATPAAYVFDAYGTLFDVHSAVRRHAGDLGETLSEIWRAKQLEYSWVRELTGAYLDFRTLTEQALDYAMASVPEIETSLRARLLEAYWELDCYEEVPEVLSRLKESGARVAILSNGSPDMLRSATKNAGIDTLLDDVFSVHPIARYKTASPTYRLVTDAYDIAPGAVSFHSSNRWDIAGARAFGFRPVWINRNAKPDEYTDLPPERVLASLSGLAAGC
ncbi:haloacid dehalogenase type II [Pararhizobium mangrovi]|uniref:(S)-2-haloacid dehalogenase n=1 Tax=Pararhizobium mangrovi TaxID=2590452 RepID=A0A506U3J8_9HYPH|nr:haloacid dehalogenase type II [Pararhizobium mangrovi]TPW27585.1 haloacid dehalogenase type II [Pararhizobium mangrovi]